jgi:hypothetical protein
VIRAVPRARKKSFTAEHAEIAEEFLSKGFLCDLRVLGG